MPTKCISKAIVEATKQIFDEQGIPDIMRSDNGRHFDSEMFITFADTWGFDHTTSSHHYPRSNGFIERAIGTVKLALKKGRASGQDADMTLLLLRINFYTKRC
jgi:hypothetical protein